jgi:hypothetical protein
MGDGEVLGIGEIVEVGEVVGFGVGVTTLTPLLQTNFLPDLIHVYFFPETVEVKPNLEQVDPGFVIAYARLIEE